MPTKRFVAIVSLVALAVPVIAGCSATSQPTSQSTGSSTAATTSPGGGVSSGSAAAITVGALLSGSQDAALAASSVHLSGTRTDSSQRSVGFEVSGTLDKSVMHGSYSYDDISYEVLVVDGVGYERGNDAYWKDEGKLSTDEIATIGGRWLRVNDSLRDQILQMSPPEIIRIAYSTMSAADFGSSVTVTTDADAPVYSLGGGERKSLIARTGDLLPVRVTTAGGSMNLDTWNAVAPISAPPADQIIDASSATPAPADSASPSAAMPSLSPAASASA